MKLVYIGKYTNTHGLKGEIKIRSDFEYKDKVFKVGNEIYIDKNKYFIATYRTHKGYDMITLDGISSINDIDYLKGSSVYIDNEYYNFEYVYSDLIGFSVYDDEYRGEITEIEKSKLYPMLKIKYNKEYLIPFIDKFIKKVDIENKKIYINYMKGLYDED